MRTPFILRLRRRAAPYAPAPALVHAENAYLHSAQQEREEDNEHYGPARHARAFRSLTRCLRRKLEPLLPAPS